MTIEQILAKSDPKFLSSGQVKMMCPFRDKHTDGGGMQSMFLSPDINSYHCFSCKSKGRMTNLLVEEFDVGYFEAIEMVHVDTAAYVKKQIEFEIKDAWEIRPPKVFLEKGFSKKTLKHFQVGMTDDNTICIPVSFSDEFKGIIFQIRKAGKDKKVWHSENLPKREILYNLNYNYDYTVLVEGPTDVWRIFDHKYNSAGCLGSDLTSEQADLLKKFKRVYVMGDNDDAGMRFNEIAYHRLRDHVEVLFIPYTSEDPGATSLREFRKGFLKATDYLPYSMAMAEHPRYEKIQQQIITKFRYEDD